MGQAPIGANVAIAYDAPGLEELGPGHALVTSTGRTYLVLVARKQTRGEYAGRWHLRCQVAEVAPAGTTIHPLVWNKRGPRPMIRSLGRSPRSSSSSSSAP